jgi:ABC-type Fe3+ transport system permease subunit
VGRPWFWDDARNSLVVVMSAVVIALIVAFLAATAVVR